ncbi:MAG: T9SS type A sorting domain-containing protein [Bacteroidota bacterium]|jgi:hypothetical protein
MKKSILFLVTTLLIIALGTTARATTRTSAATGNWSSTGTWVGGNVPDASDTVIVASGHIVTVNGGYSCTCLILNAPAANNGVTIGGSNSLTVDGAITMNAPSTGTVTSTISVGTGSLYAGSIAIPGSPTAGRFCTVSVSTGTLNVTGDITFSGTAAQARLTFNGAGTLNLTGNLSDGGTFTASTGTVNCNGSSAQTVGGYTYNVLKSNNTAGVTLSAADTIKTLTIGDVAPNAVFNDGGFVITPATGSVLNLTGGTYNLGSAIVGTAWPAWGTANISVGTTVAYVSDLDQTVSIVPSYQNLTFSGSGTKTPPAGTLTVGGHLTVSAGKLALDVNSTLAGVAGNIYIDGGTFARGAGNVTCTGLSIGGTCSSGTNGSFTVNGNVSGAGALTTGSVARVFYVTGHWTFNGTSTGSVKLTMNGTGTQVLSGVINSGAAAVGALIINKASGTVTLGSNITVTGSDTSMFTLKAGTFDATTHLLTATKDTLIAGTLRVGAATWAANYSFSPIPPAGVTIEYYNANPTINSSITYQNLQFSGTGTAGASGPLTLQGNLTNTGGGTLNFGANNVTVSGSVTGATNIAGFTTSGTFSHTRTTGAGTTLTSDVSVESLAVSAGALNLGTGHTHTVTRGVRLAGGTLSGGSSTLHIGGNMSGPGSFNANTSTLHFNAAGPQTTGGYIFNNLTLSGSGAKTITGATINGTLSRQGTATVTGTPTYGGSASLVYAGSAAQTMGAELPATMAQPVTINNSNDVELGNSKTINGTLTFSSGNLVLGSMTLTLGGTVSGAAATKCVVTDGNGVVSRSIATADSFSFPIGPSTTTYNPVTLTNNTGSTYTYTAHVVPINSPTTPDNTQAGSVTWTLSGAATGGSGVDLAFTWLTSQAGWNVVPAGAVAWEYNGSVWVQAGGTTVIGTPNVTTVTGQTSLSPWIIGNPNALPIELASLTANAVDNNVNLEWSTISETNTLGFYVERGSSKTGPLSAVSSLIPGAGTSLEQHNYSYTDNNVSSGTYYYRLHQVDKNGAGSYSSVITVTVSGALGVGDKRPLPTEFALEQNYPNPFNPSTTISYQLPKQSHVTLKVFDVLGREIATLVNGEQAPGYKSVAWSAANAASGVYFCRLVTEAVPSGHGGSFVETKKLVLMR